MKRTSLSTRTRRLITAGVSVLGVLLLAFAVFLTEGPTIIARHFLTPHRHTDDSQYARYPVDVQPLSVVTADGLNLSAQFIRTHHGSHALGTVIILHGSSGCEGFMVFLAKIFSDEGFDAVIYDSRAHGQSEGQLCTFGFLEKGDVSRVIDSVEAHYPDHGPISAVGISMGAAVVLQAMAIEPRIRCGVAIAPFATLKEMADLDLTGLKPWERAKIEIAGEALMGCSFGEVSPCASAGKITAPVLIIHGDQDATVPISQGKSDYDALHSHGAEWLPVKGAGHGDILDRDKPWGPLVYGHMLDFVKRWSVQ